MSDRALLCSEEEAQENAKKFESEDIGDILAQRTSKRIMRGGGKAGGGTFSVANFKQDDGVTNGAESADFWRSLLPDAVKAAELAEQNRGLVSGPRRRRAVNYNEEKVHKEAEDKLKAEVRHMHTHPLSHYVLHTYGNSYSIARGSFRTLLVSRRLSAWPVCAIRRADHRSHDK